ALSENRDRLLSGAMIEEGDIPLDGGRPTGLRRGGHSRDRRAGAFRSRLASPYRAGRLRRGFDERGRPICRRAFNHGDQAKPRSLPKNSYKKTARWHRRSVPLLPASLPCGAENDLHIKSAIAVRGLGDSSGAVDLVLLYQPIDVSRRDAPH